MRDLVYHYSDSARLPWIVEAGELRPGHKQAPNHPLALLWATVSPQGDPTASAFCDAFRAGYRMGTIALVRFALDPADFEPWGAGISQRHPEWTAARIREFECETRKRFGDKLIAYWRVRADPLPLSRVLRIEIKRYHRNTWQIIDDTACVAKVVQGKLMRGVVSGGDVFISFQDIRPERIFYDVARASTEEWANLK
jgi:hypothetical protein